MMNIRLLRVTIRLRLIGITLGALAALVVMIVTTGGWTRNHVLAFQSESASPVRSAVFEEDGSLRLPAGYRQWEHVGTRIKPDGRSVLDGSQITTPQVMDTYIAPAAFNFFKKNGIWPDGTQIVKEISLIKTGKDCDKSTFVCSTAFGSGIFQAGYIGMGMMVKDSKRFPSAPGNWGYFAFRSNGSMYQATATVRPQQQCASCHMRLASNTDYVFSSTHIGLLPGNSQ
jgi:cytochrome P460